jgi:hypothetical protein
LNRLSAEPPSRGGRGVPPRSSKRARTSDRGTTKTAAVAAAVLVCTEVLSVAAHEQRR